MLLTSGRGRRGAVWLLRAVDAPTLALAAVAVFLVAGTHTRHGGWNDASRLAMVEAIVEHGHLWVDGTEMSRFTGDVARIDGRFYSDKPPALAFFAVPVYAAQVALGWTFRDHPRRTYYLTTLLTVGLPTLLGLVALERFLRRIVPAPAWRAAVIAGVGLGTLNTAYSVTFSNHPPAATALLLTFLLVWRRRRFGGGIASVAVAGLVLGIAALTDHGAIFYAPALLVYLAWPPAPGLVSAAAFAAGLVWPLAGFAAYNVALTGSAVPLSLQPALFDYPGSYFATHGQLTGTALLYESPAALLRYVGLCLVGWRGLFPHTPAMLFVLAGMTRIAARPGHSRRVEAVVALVPTILLVVYYFLASADPGGNAYGVRWYCLFMPLTYVFLADAYRTFTTAWARALFWSAFALSFPLAWIGALDPWMDPTPYGTGFSFVLVLRKHGWWW